MEWKLAEAKSRFSELVNKALSEGPQTVSRRKDRVGAISEYDHNKLKGQKPNFIEFLVDGSLNLSGVNFERDKSLSRKVDV